MNSGWLSGAPSESQWGTTGLVSIALHVLVFAVATHTWLLWVKRMAPVGTAHGTQRVLLSMPGHTLGYLASGSAPVKVRPVEPKIRQVAFRPKASTIRESAGSGSAQNVAAGNDALGAGSVSIAWIQAFPAAKPDFSKLLAGAPVDVVVDVQIDDRGRVARAIAKRGMGHEIDEVVVATVEQWVFYPAIKNGRAVASEQELHFHYERGRGAEACGWNCFELAGR